MFLSGFNNDVLRALVVVARHGDRTPKQKVKFKTSDEIIISILRPFLPKEAKFKRLSEFPPILLAIQQLAAKEKQAQQEDERARAGSTQASGSRQCVSAERAVTRVF